MKTKISPVHVFLGCSLDGFIAGPNNALDWLQTDYSEPGDIPKTETFIDYPDFIKDIGCLLMGRTTFDVVSSFEEWPYGDLPVLVASHHPITAPKACVLREEGSIAALISKAKILANGKGVYLDGGNLARQGLNAGMVDTLTLSYLPILLGQGTRLFDVLDQKRHLQFVSIGASGRGLVQVRARCSRRSFKQDV